MQAVLLIPIILRGNNEKHELILKGEYKFGLFDLLPTDEKGWQNQYLKFSIGLGF